MSGHRCAILAVDPGARSGWCVSDGGERIVLHGIATQQRDREVAVSNTYAVARTMRVPLVVVIESFSRFGRWGRAAQAGTDAQAGRWLAALDTAAADYDPLPMLERAAAYRGVVRVDSSTWYRAVIGSTRDGREARITRTMATMGVSDPDVACAMAMAQWARHATAVGAKLPVAFRAGAGR